MKATRRTLGLVLAAALGIVAMGQLANVPKAGADGASKKQKKAPPIIISYGSDPLQFDIVYPAPTPGSPLVALVHGDDFLSSANLAEKLSSEALTLQHAGFAVFVVDYRSDIGAPAFPDEVDDVMAGTQFAMDNADTYNADPSNVTIIGGSASGDLVGLAAEGLDKAAPGTVTNLITLSGTFDLPAKLTYAEALHNKLGKQFIKNIMSASGCSTPASCPTPFLDTYSPDMQVTSENCPGDTLIFNESEESQPVEQADLMTEALQTAGCAASEDILWGTGHSFAYWNAVEPTIVSFIAQAH
jgi:acetyl esterase/lipase